MESRKFHFDSALTPQGWQGDVTVAVDGAGLITRVEAGRLQGAEHLAGIAVPAMPNVHSHAHQRFMLGLAERREEWNLCITERGIEYQVSSSQYHEFFGQGEENTVECDRTVVVWPIELTEGAVTEPLCTIRGQEWLPRWEVIGADTRLLEGHEIDTMHVRLTVHDTDGYLETTTIDWWIDEHGLPVEMRATEDSTADSGAVGDLHYLETYQAALVSATPME